MAISKLQRKKNPYSSASDFMKGASEEVSDNIRREKAVLLRCPTILIDRIDRNIKERTARVTRTQLIVEALERAFPE